MDLFIVSWGIYLGVGSLYAFYLLFFNGLKKIDPATSQSGWGFRLLIFPGIAALWPLLILKSNSH